MNSEEKCPVCREMLNDKIERYTGDNVWYSCPRCSDFIVSRTLDKKFKMIENGVWRWVTSHYIKSMNNAGRKVDLHTGNIEDIFKQELPDPVEQSENLLRAIGSKIKIASESIKINAQYFSAVIGAKDSENVDYIGEYLENKNLIKYEIEGSGKPNRIIGLTVEGWEKYHELKTGSVDTTLAFMAMKFDDPELDQVYSDHIKPTVDGTGFELRKLNDIPKAGLIDNHIRAEIRRSRLLLADLTHGNNGAYWEAGYAEGIGIPVIYLCKKAYFDEGKTHFDTNHHTTVLWSQDTMQDDMKNLTATIRNTFPELF